MPRHTNIANYTAVGAMLLLALHGAPLFACMETIVEYETNRLEGRLLDYKGEPLPSARLVIRDASDGSRGPRTLGGARKGPVVAKGKTDKDGRFAFPKLRAGRYWLTFMDKERGESFLITVTSARSEGELKFHIDRQGAGVCYVVDVERNATKPPGWTVPIKEDKN